MSQNNLRTQPFGGRRRLRDALLALLLAGYSRQSPEFIQTKEAGFTSGKHNGRTPGAFGGPNRAKKHRRCYLTAA